MNAPSGPSTSSRSPSRAPLQIFRHHAARDDPHQEFHLREIARRRAHRVRAPLLGAGHLDSHVLAGMEGNAGAALQRDRKFRDRGHRPFDAGHARFEIAALLRINQRARVMQAHHARRERVRTAEQALAFSDFRRDKRERAVARHLERPAHQSARRRSSSFRNGTGKPAERPGAVPRRARIRPRRLRSLFRRRPRNAGSRDEHSRRRTAAWNWLRRASMRALRSYPSLCGALCDSGGSWMPRLKRAATLRQVMVAASKAHSDSRFHPSPCS